MIFHYEILISRDGVEALALTDSQQPDLVITDIMMSYSSGMEIVGYIRQKYQQKIKVIVLSGMGQEKCYPGSFPHEG
ncbi:MAG: response regulator [Bacteroidota bacterium]